MKCHAAAGAILLLSSASALAAASPAVDGTTVVRGSCKRLEIDGRKVPSCAGELRFVHGRDGRNAILFLTDDGRA